MNDDVTIADVPEAERYELHVGGELAGYAEYRGRGDVRALVHTEVDSAFEGRGLAARLVTYALEDLRARNVSVVPICPYVVKFLGEHREYLDTVQPHIQRAFNLT